jgi:flagellar export protein FliJ
MRKFRFRLQVVLDQARREEDTAAQALANADRRRMEAQKELDARRRRGRELERKLAREQLGALDMTKLRELQAALETNAAEIAEQVATVEDLDAEVSRHREQVVERMKRRRMLERLHHSHEQLHLLNERSIETKILDEIGTAKSARAGSPVTT